MQTDIRRFPNIASLLLWSGVRVLGTGQQNPYRNLSHLDHLHFVHLPACQRATTRDYEETLQSADGLLRPGCSRMCTSWPGHPPMLHSIPASRLCIDSHSDTEWP